MRKIVISIISIALVTALVAATGASTLANAGIETAPLGLMIQKVDSITGEPLPAVAVVESAHTPFYRRSNFWKNFASINLSLIEAILLVIAVLLFAIVVVIPISEHKTAAKNRAVVGEGKFNEKEYEKTNRHADVVRW